MDKRVFLFLWKNSLSKFYFIDLSFISEILTVSLFSSSQRKKERERIITLHLFVCDHYPYHPWTQVNFCNIQCERRNFCLMVNNNNDNKSFPT